MFRSAMLLLGAPALVSASTQPRVEPLTTITYRADGTAGKLITIPVRVNGAAPRWFVLDTGAPRSALDGRLAAELKLGSIRTSREGGTGHGTVAAGHPAPFDLSIGSVRLHVADPLTLDFAQVPISKEDRGLVGSELISSYVVRIDPVSRRLSIFDPRSFKPSPGDVRLPLGVDAERRRFYLDAV